MTSEPSNGQCEGSGEAQDRLPPDDIARRLRLALDVSKIGVFDADLETGRVKRDAVLMQIFGYGDEAYEDEGDVLERTLHPEDRDRTWVTIDAGIASGEPFYNAFRIIRPDGEVRYIRSRSVTFSDSKGHRRLLGANWDATDDVTLQQNLEQARALAESRYTALESAWREIERRALQDQLTGLSNRHALLLHLDKLCSEPEPHIHPRPCPRPCPRHAVLQIDLSRFKEINDTLGHQAGDAAILCVAGRLEALREEKECLARIGGNEFALVLDAGDRSENAAHLATKIVQSLEQPIPCEGHLFRCGVSVGLAWTSDDVDGPQALINAATALSAAKARKGGGTVLFTEELDGRNRAIRQTADDILRGIDEDAFIPFYQLQFDAKTLDVCGAEALARWRHPSQGILTPDRFLKIAEDIDVMWRIDRSLAEKACADFLRWRNNGSGVDRLSINVSVRRLIDPHLIAAFPTKDLPKGTFVFEMLESICLDVLDDDMAKAIDRIRRAGIAIEIDDFGTGHASVLGLTTLQPKRLKIDRALIAPMTRGDRHRRLIAAIIEMGHALDIEIIAEGVETTAQVQLLQDMGCDVLQGFALARPMDAEAVEAFLRARKRARRPSL
ncbi:diguanylate cyclase (GGDEF)-like protein [Rhizobium sp. PP-F2F-G48]|uniref:putative bifunctional diguanylate cyclase/phosphodiesterase n=1 Tax=Rhizobium sp. PP-F2F-G48 TaxID=2135651 RepID=UPI00104C89AE|nr:GGDEF domain-containing phosphodiesterase [Rhizobium sp. PP-F2F-G48]TCM58945.1 diguanylate cyclase (GGDEF)-like protein [Rhizobium sp. PP-F2F-G48]